MATMRDVARAAGVSVGTVSNYVNAPGLVAPATAARIREVIDDLGYSVDFTARAFRTRQTYTVGLVVPTITNPYFAEIARVVAHALWESGLQTFLCDAAADPTRERKHLQELVARRVDGILISHGGDPDDLQPFTERLSTPIVFFDRAVPGQHSVDSDNRLGGRLAAEHLAGLGHRVVGILAGDSTQSNIRERIAGFADEFRRRGLDIDARHVLSGPQELELGYRVGELLASEPRPSALFCTNDIVAIGAWRTLVGLDRRIPEDVSLIGFDDIEMSSLTVPALTTIAQDKAAIGREASAMLLRLMRGEPAPLTTTHIPPRLVVRGSTAVPAGVVVSPAATSRVLGATVPPLDAVTQPPDIAAAPARASGFRPGRTVRRAGRG
jgi:LacI family transcriptional regulator